MALGLGTGLGSAVRGDVTPHFSSHADEGGQSCRRGQVGLSTASGRRARTHGEPMASAVFSEEVM